MLAYIQGIILTAIEMICCKIFFETFGQKRIERKLINNGIMIGLILFVYTIALLFYNQFIVKQILVIIGIAIL